MYRLLLLISASLWSASSAIAQEEALRLLPGTWISESDSSMREIWDFVPGGLKGRSVKINPEGEEDVWEELRVYYEGDTLVYEASVRENGSPVLFRLLRKDKNELLFTNPAHDFPRFIHYRWLDADHLSVEVYSRKGGKKLLFHFYRQGGTD